MASDGLCVPASPPRRAIHSSLRHLIVNANLSPSSPNYGKISSPMSSLALNLSGLSTDIDVDNFGGTPRRRLSLSSVDTPENLTPPPSASLVDDGIFTVSPGYVSSPTVEMSLSKLAQEYNKDRPSSYGRSRCLPFRKLQNTPIPAFRLSPIDFDDSSDDDEITTNNCDINTKLSTNQSDSLGCSSEGSDLNADTETETETMCIEGNADCLIECEQECGLINTFQRQGIVHDVVIDTVSRSLDFNLSDDQLDASDTELHPLECSYELKDCSVRLDDSDSQGIVADIDDSFVCHNKSLNDSYVLSNRMFNQSAFSDVNGSFTCLNQGTKSYTCSTAGNKLFNNSFDEKNASLSDASSLSDLEGSFISPIFSESLAKRTSFDIISPRKAVSYRSPRKSGDFNPTGILDDDGSHDSGVSMEKDDVFNSPKGHGIETVTMRTSFGLPKHVFSSQRIDDDSFTFPVPVSAAPRRMRVISEDTCSPIKYSPIKTPTFCRTSPPCFNTSFLTPNLSKLAKSPSESSPVSLKTSPLTGISTSTGSNDDGFIGEIDKEVQTVNITESAALPDSFSSLFSAPVINTPQTEIFDSQKSKRVCRKLLDRSISVQECRSRSQKRVTPMVEGETIPTPCKRRRSSLFTDSAIVSSPNISLPRPKAPLKRCSSESEAIIKSILNKVTEDTNLIGDGSKPYLLPVTKGRHADLKSITPDTLATVLTHNFDEIDRCIVIDCRYPYEYEGGHISGSQNLYQKQDILDKFLRDPLQTSDPEKRVLIVFHCEFSAERAPTLSRFLRNKDRDTNKDNYPDLYYPELYLLDGGYKAFYEKHADLCTPQSYKPMLHEDHREDLRKFRIKSRSWTDDKTRTSLRLKF